MAKRKSVKRAEEKNAAGQRVELGDSGRFLGQPSFSPASLMGLAAAMIAAALVYAGYWPNDSIEVQIGGARYLVGLLLAAATLAMVVRGPVAAGDWLIDALAWGLALWMIVATWANAEHANLRLAVNELWWWIAAAAALSATRRCVSSLAIALAMLYIISGVTAGVAVFGWHQLLIGFPQLIAEYKANPDAVLHEAGIVAEEGSALRILFENRLKDGGPTGTFALANSMAAMLVGGSVVMIGLVGQQWRRLSRLRRIGWSATLLVTLGMLLASHSRSAVGSVVLIAFIYVCLRLLATRRAGGATRWPRPGVLIGGLVALLLALGLGVTLAWRTLSQSEWVAQAPASLAIRLNYWRGCARMLAESPLVGVGPGQFKARYEAFRAPEATEQIADPHNWLWQALTTGGLPAGLLLLGLAAAIVWRFARPPADARYAQRPLSPVDPAVQGRTEMTAQSAAGHNEDQTTEPLAFPNRWVYAGAGAAGIAIWLAGAMVGYLPMLDAALLASAAGIAVVCLAAWGGVAAQDAAQHEPAIRRLALWTLAAMLVNLLAAGGLTVPGVAVTLWVLAGIAVPCATLAPTVSSEPIRNPDVRPRSGTDSSRWSIAAAESDKVSRGPERVSIIDRGRGGVVRWVIGGIAAVLLLSWYVTAILPVEQAAGPMARFQMAWTQRSYGEAELALRQAMAADRWDPQPPLQLAQVLMQQALYSPDERQRWEARWQEVEAEALRRSGSDPVNLRLLADARLWHYQRYGDSAVLQATAELYRRIVELSPSHQAYAAQLAELYQQLDDPRAGELASRADYLSQAGGYYERSLPLIILLPAEHFGEAALSNPVRRPASEVLAPLLEPPN